MSFPGLDPSTLINFARSTIPRLDPFTSYNYVVAISFDIPIAGFSEVSGINSEIEFDEYKEGGLNEYIHKFPRITKYNNLVLSHGISHLPFLYDWYKDCVFGKIEKREIMIFLFDPKRAGFKMWTFKNAFPVKWSGPDLNASSNEVAIESLELAHEGLVW